MLLPKWTLWNSPCLILTIYIPSSLRSRETGRSMRWRRRRRRSRLHSNVAGVHAAQPMPSLTHAVTPTSSHPGVVSGGDRLPAKDPRPASARFHKERQRIYEPRRKLSKTVAGSVLNAWEGLLGLTQFKRKSCLHFFVAVQIIKHSSSSYQVVLLRSEAESSQAPGQSLLYAQTLINI